MEKNKVVIFLILLTLFSCGVGKSNIYDEYRTYKVLKGLDPDVPRPFKYFENFLAYKDSIKKQKLRDSPYLKTNEVYVYYRNSNSVSFSVFGDDGYEYASTLDIGGDILEHPKNGKIKLKKNLILTYFGKYDLKKNSIITKKRSKSPFKEWYEDYNAFIRGDTIHYVDTYISKKREYKKKWLAKTHKLMNKLIYQPSLKAVKTKIFRFGSEMDVFVITGEFFMKEDKTVVKW